MMPLWIGFSVHGRIYFQFRRLWFRCIMKWTRNALCVAIKDSPVLRILKLFNSKHTIFSSPIVINHIGTTVTIPPRPPVTSTSSKPFQSWPVNHLVVLISHISITHFFTAQEIQSREWEKNNKEQTNNKAWVNSSVRRLSCDTAFPVD